MMLTYSEWLQKLYGCARFSANKVDLSTVRLLQEKMGFLDRTFSVVHIAGTNGKGSVATKVAKGLEVSGYRAGLFTSPHLISFRERIQIHGEMISEEEVVEGLSAIFSLAEREGISPSFFDVTTLLAMRYFARKEVDYAVFETGVGGRLDATNIVEPVVCAITSIAIDHANVLGSTIEAIAKEKGGIIKPGVPVVIGPTVPVQVTLPIAWARCSPHSQVLGDFPDFDAENRAVAQAVLNAFDLLLDSELLDEAVQVRPPCRMELVRENVILDVAHNPSAFERLFQSVEKHHPGVPVRVVAGFSKQKDISGCLAVAQSQATCVHLVVSDHPLLASEEELQQYVGDGVVLHRSVEEGLHKACEHADKAGEMVVVCGSAYMMQNVMKNLGERTCK